MHEEEEGVALVVAQSAGEDRQNLHESTNGDTGRAQEWFKHLSARCPAGES